jgi:hypothetical protein
MDGCQKHVSRNIFSVNKYINKNWMVETYGARGINEKGVD